MEDLSEDGFVLSKYDFIFEDKVKAVVKEIAKMQAEWIKTSLNIDWRETEKESIEENWAKVFNNFSTFAPTFNELVEDNEKIKDGLNKVQVLIGNKDYYIWAFRNAYKELGLPTVLVHGDLWNSNVFFKNDSQSEIVAFVDWQMAYEGSPVADLARYLLLDTEGPVRRRIEAWIFSFYIKCLKSEIPDMAIHESQIQKAYIFSFIFEFIGLLVITVNNAKNLQHLIDKNENVQENLRIKKKIILQVIQALEDVMKIFDAEFEEVVQRFKLKL